MKNITKWLACGALAACLCAAFAPTTQAQINKEKTTFTLTEPLNVGGTLLQPGTYKIKVVELSYNRNIVQVTNTEGTKVFAAALGTPHPTTLGEMIPESRFVYFAPIAGQPKALRTWFGPDTPYGQDILYTKSHALEIAAAVKEPVLAVPDDVKEADYKTVPLEMITADQKVVPYEPPTPTTQPTLATTLIHKPLPHTASRVPLQAALGLLSLAGALALRAIVNRMS